MKDIKRNSIIRIHLLSNGRFKVTDKDGNTLIGEDEVFEIYFKSVKFSNKGFVEARFLGYMEDGEFNPPVQQVFFTSDKGWLYVDCKMKIYDAKMGKADSEKGVSVLVRAN